MLLLKSLQKSLIALLLAGALFFLTKEFLFAEGTHYNIGTPTAIDGSYDAVSWSTGYPITIDSFGSYIIPVQATGSAFAFATSNDAGSTWHEFPVSESLFRPSAAYDPTNDSLHVLSASADGVVYRRYSISRNSADEIIGYTLDSDVGELLIDGDDGGACSAFEARNPILLHTTQGGSDKIVAFWSVEKTCGVSTFTQNRASMRVLSHDTDDGLANNWVSLDGTSDGGDGPAEVAFDILYAYAGNTPIQFQQSALIQGTGGTHVGDIYYFTVNENDIHGWRRLSWNGGSQNWSGAWTSIQQFGGDVSGTGYSLNQELMSKPVFDDALDRVYIGIARWLDTTNGDTQSLYYIDNADQVQFVDDIYSAGGAHDLYPTFDIAYDQVADELYYFYLTSGGSDSGHTYYVTYDGTTLSTPEAFFTDVGETVDIPVVYPNRYQDRLLLFFRKNQTADPHVPPHEIFFGFVDLSGDAPNTSDSKSYATFGDFSQVCTTQTDTMVSESGAVQLRRIEDTFGPNLASTFASRWNSDTWGGGSYSPNPTGGELVINSANGAYIESTSTVTRVATVDFRAKFTAGNFQHVGFVDNNSFGRFFMFSTMSNGQLNARGYDGSTAINTPLGSSYLGAYHDYRIVWDTTEVRFYIDEVLVDTYPHSYAGSLAVLASNNSQSALTDLTLDSVAVSKYPATSGTYTSCTVNAGMDGARWSAISSTGSSPSGTSYALQARTSTDNVNWTSWTTVAGGGSLATLGRFFEYRLQLSGTSDATPSISAVSFNYALPAFSFATATDTALENAAGDVTITLNLDSALTQDVVVPITISGTAADGSDFTLSDTEFSFATGETTDSLTLSILNESTFESDETVVLSLTVPSNTRLVSPSTFTYTIQNDDSAPASSPSPTPATTTSNNSSNSSTNESGPQTCTAQLPGSKSPTIYAASAQSFDTIKIYFTPGDGPLTKFALEYGKSSEGYKHATLFDGSSESRTVVIGELASATEYVFRVRALNDCAPGNWSNELRGTTLPRWSFGALALDTTSITATQSPTAKQITPSESASAQQPPTSPLPTPSPTSQDSTTVPGVIPKLVLILKDDSGAPLAGASVTLHSTPREGRTDETGTVTFTDVEKGQHRLFITHANYTGEQSLYLETEKDHLEITVTVRQANPFYLQPVFVIGASALLLITALFFVWNRKK